ncbi:MAG: type II toxin-antitoxin system MqsA family antitoxin [Eubacteriales bacterium]|nr:type II toxin-antitoxin system MqsA family antitoxin [Eubacteriales bacterium]
MKCLFCKEDMQPGKTAHVVELQNCVVVVRNVPCLKCEQCGEVFLSGKVVKTLEHIVSTLQSAMTEVAVVNYPDKAA